MLGGRSYQNSSNMPCHASSMSVQKVLELDRGFNYELLLGSKTLRVESRLLISSIARRVPCDATVVISHRVS
jgi:hypothetical protein